MSAVRDRFDTLACLLFGSVSVGGSAWFYISVLGCAQRLLHSG